MDAGEVKAGEYRRCWYSMKRHGQSGYYVSSLSIHAFQARRASASLVCAYSRVYTRSKSIRDVIRAGTKCRFVSPSISAYALSRSQTFNERELSVCSFCALLRQNRDPSLARLASSSFTWFFQRIPVFQANDGNNRNFFSGFSIFFIYPDAVFRWILKVWENS